MPNLPTITLPQNHYDRVVNAFPGDTLAKKAAAYNAWTINNLIDFVGAAEMRKIDEETNASKAAKMAELTSTLPEHVPYPPT